MIKIARSRLES